MKIRPHADTRPDTRHYFTAVNREEWQFTELSGIKWKWN